MIELANKDYFCKFLNTHNHSYKKTLRAIEREFGLSNGTMSRWCRVHCIKPLSRSTAARISGKIRSDSGVTSGKNHWAFGMTKETSKIHKASSDRMKKNNPIRTHTKKVLEGHLKRHRKSFVLGEELFKNYLNICGITGFIHQFITGGGIRDFAFPEYKIAIEIDGRGHSGRFATDLKKDLASIKDGWVIIRVAFDNRRPKTEFKLVFDILKKIIPDFNGVCPFPSYAINKDWVLIRDFKDPTGIKVYSSDEVGVI